MRNEYKPGDLSIRLTFGRVYGSSPDAGKVRPQIEVSDETSGLTMTIEITAEQLTDMLSGSAAQVTADKVTGYQGVKQWGRYLKVKQTNVVPPVGGKDYSHKSEPRELEHVDAACRALEAEGYQVRKPDLSHGVWRINGRRYDDQP